MTRARLTAHHIRWLFSLWLVLLVTPSQGLAQERTDPPVRVALAGSFQVFQDSRSRENALALGETFSQSTADYVIAHPEIYEFVSPQKVQRVYRQRPGYLEILDLARQQAEFGVQQYKELNTAGAIESLSRARSNFKKIRHDLTAPREVADVVLYLALSHLEEGKEVLTPLNLFKEMLLLNPTLELRRGYYQDSVVSFFQNARQELIQELRERGPRLEQLEQIRSLARSTGAQLVLYGMVLPAQEGQHEVDLYIYSAREGRANLNVGFEKPERAFLDALNPDSLESVASRLISRYSSCLYQPVEPVSSNVPSGSGTSPLSIEVHMLYTSFQTYRRITSDDRPWGHYGLGFGANWSFTQEFSLVTNLQFLISVSNYDNSLASQNNSTIRSFFGGALDLDISRWSFGIQVALEVTRVNEFEFFRNIDCGHPELRDPGCFQNTLVLEDWLLGINARPRIAFQLYRTLDLFLTGSGSFFFFAAGNSEFNFPLSAESGLQYRF